MYQPLGATATKLNLRFVRYDPKLRQVVRTGPSLRFGHLEDEDTVHDWQGSEIPFIGFDELTHFTEKQFFYMLSRNRSTTGVPGYMRATCNPDADSWVRALIDWWIGPDGYPISERSGTIRWFIRIDDTLHWGDSREELVAKYGVPITDAKSFTFIPARLEDNKILMRTDPAYLSNLRAMARVDRLRLHGGNWNVKVSAGSLFQRQWMPVIDAVPSGWTKSIRFWDRAATKPNENNRDPDWTRGLKMYKYPNGTFVVVDLKSMRDTPGQVETLICNTASHDSTSVRIMSQRDPGSAGVSESERFIRMLAGYMVRTEPMSGDKVTRAKPVSAQCEAGNVRVLRAPWNEEFFTELENFSEDMKTGHDDIIDVLSGAFNALVGGVSLADVL